MSIKEEILGALISSPHRYESAFHAYMVLRAEVTKNEASGLVDGKPHTSSSVARIYHQLLNTSVADNINRPQVGAAIAILEEQLKMQFIVHSYLSDQDRSAEDRAQVAAEKMFSIATNICARFERKTPYML